MWNTFKDEHEESWNCLQYQQGNTQSLVSLLF